MALQASDVRNHELLLHPHWLAQAARDEASGMRQGHGPDHYAQQLISLLRRCGPSVPKKVVSRHTSEQRGAAKSALDLKKAGIPAPTSQGHFSAGFEVR